MVEKGVLDSAKEGAIPGAYAGFAVGAARSFLYAQDYAKAAVTEAAKNTPPRLPSTSMLSKVPFLNPTVSLSYHPDRTLSIHYLCVPI